MRKLAHTSWLSCERPSALSHSCRRFPVACSKEEIEQDVEKKNHPKHVRGIFFQGPLWLLTCWWEGDNSGASFIVINLMETTWHTSWCVGVFFAALPDTVFRPRGARLCEWSWWCVEKQSNKGIERGDGDDKSRVKKACLTRSPLFHTSLIKPEGWKVAWKRLVDVRRERRYQSKKRRMTHSLKTKWKIKAFNYFQSLE